MSYQGGHWSKAIRFPQQDKGRDRSLALYLKYIELPAMTGCQFLGSRTFQSEKLVNKSLARKVILIIAIIQGNHIHKTASGLPVLETQQQCQEAEAFP